MFDESLWEAVPEQYRGFSLQNLMESNRTEVERFRAYIQVRSITLFSRQFGKTLVNHPSHVIPFI